MKLDYAKCLHMDAVKIDFVGGATLSVDLEDQ